MLKKYNIFSKLILIGVLVIFIFSSFNHFKDDPKRKVKTIVIDAGHGGKDPGCSGLMHNEKSVALAVALRLGKFIEDNMKDVQVIYTRKTDVFVDLEDRAKLANDNNADLFISIHCNAAGKPVMIKDKNGKMRAKMIKNSKGKLVVVETVNPVPFGSETYVMGMKNEEGKMRVAQRENAAILLEDNYEKKYEGFDPNSEESYIIMSNYTSSYVILSASLAQKIQEEYSKKAGRVDKGVNRQSIWVLWRTAMPSILTEIGYLTNPDEEQFLGSEKGQEYMAACLFRAFRKYKDEQEGNKKNYDDAIENQKPAEKEVYLAVSTTTVIEEKIEVPKKDIKEVKKDSIKKSNTPIEIKDTLKFREPLKDPENTNEKVDKNNIIKKYKDKNKKDSSKVITSEIKNKTILFKVQFAASDKEVDAKIKYLNVPDIGFYKAGTTYKYTSGNYNSFDEATIHQNKLKELGYKDCFVAAFKEGIRMDINEAKKAALENK